MSNDAVYALIMKTQKENIKDWLVSGKPLTGLMAVQLFGCTNLSRVITRLKKEGLLIKSEYATNGSGHAFKKYFVDENRESNR